MPKNPYFLQGSFTPEKDLLMSIASEVISIHGTNIIWIQNPHTNVDALFGEDRLPVLGAGTEIVAYIKDAMQGVIGDPLFSKFGFMNQQTMNIQIAVKEWDQVFGTHRPMEGDIFYVPFQDEYGPADFFKVTFVDRDEATGWFPLGKHIVFDIMSEKWAYSSEDFANTGIDEIDGQLLDWSNDITINPNLEADPTKVNDVVQEIADSFVVFNTDNPFGRS